MASTDNCSNNRKENGRKSRPNRHLSDPVPGEQEILLHQEQRHVSGDHPQHEHDLFSILSSMHLTNHITGNHTASHSQQIMAMPHPVVVASRKRKILDGGGHGGFSGGGSAGKLNGTRHPALRRNSDDDDEAPLQTPQCSQSGYADEEDRQAAENESQQQTQQGNKPKRSSGNILGSPEMHDIVDDNLAADFDGSLSGLGVDIHTASFSMSEALNALPNLSISSSQYFKQEMPSPAQVSSENQNELSGSGTESDKNKKNFGALDLSNDEAYLPETNDNPNREDSGPMTFTGSVSRESTPSLNFSQQLNRLKQDKSYNVVNLSASNPNLSSVGDGLQGSCKPQKIIIPLQNPLSQKNSNSDVVSQDNMKLEKRSYETIAITELDINQKSAQVSVNSNSENFQYILAASTSIATKLNEPSITYLNQGQAYELRMKKLGDLSQYRKRSLKSVLRICFHERRLQYMEAEQIAEWSSKHPGETIIDVDLPLSYGILDHQKDPKNINCLSFRWDPTRDTGVFIKVNCISTEFTPKKHGGEKGVPFRLQVETYDNDSRIHAAGCILQVFKLKGADRKHKQDRDKINKRPLAEQEKYAPSFECTVLNELSMEHIYVPANLSRPASPIHVQAQVQDQVQTTPSSIGIERQTQDDSKDTTAYSHLEGTNLEHNANGNQVQAWLIANRFNSYAASFRGYDGRDMLRLTRDESLALCGTADGIRLYNNLQSVPIPPRTIIYVGGKDGENEYSALYLDELTVSELLKKLTEAFGVDLGLFTRAFLIGPKGIYVHLTDSVVRHLKTETVMQFSLRASAQNAESRGGFDVIFEEIQALDTRTSNSSPANNGSTG